METPPATAERHTGSWVLREVEVPDAPTVVTDDEEAVEYAERDRWHCEEVHRGDGCVEKRANAWLAHVLSAPVSSSGKWFVRKP